MKVFGIGLNKTGSTTLKICFKMLGYNPIGLKPKLLRQIKRGNFEETYSIIKKYNAFQDLPWSLIYQEVDEQYPDSKFILTIRKDSETWYNSVLKHVQRAELANDHIQKELALLAYGYPNPQDFQEELMAFYEKHNQEVKEHFSNRPEKLLTVCWETGSGWPELCSFLDKEIPSFEFPHANKAADNLIAKNMERRRRNRRKKTII